MLMIYTRRTDFTGPKDSLGSSQKATLCWKADFTEILSGLVELGTWRKVQA